MPKYLFFYLAIFLLLAACAGPTALPTPTPTPLSTPTTTGRGAGDTLHILNPQAPAILNPHLSVSIKDWDASRITYEPLASFDKDGHLIPFLAVEIPTLENGGLAADGKSVTWKLRPNVKWSDGQPFTADDVLFTYQFVSNPAVKASTASIYKVIESVKALDPLTVKVNFKEANPAWASPFVGVRGSILPRHIFEPFNGANVGEAPANTLPVGTGPYRVMSPGIKPQEVLLLGAQLVETNKIVYEPNPYFREPDKPYFSRIELRGGGTAGEAARQVLQNGEVDYAYELGQLPPAELDKLAAGGAGQLVANFGSRVERILLNRTDPNREAAGERSSLKIAHPFLSDKKVRQALAYAIDRETIAALYGPGGRPTGKNLVAPPQYKSPNTFYEFNLQKAATLLDEAGWIDSDGDDVRDKNGVKMKVVFQGKVSDIVQQTQQIIKAHLESIGFEVEEKITPSSKMFTTCNKDPDSDGCFNADLMTFSIRSPNPDPSSYMAYWTCAQIPQKANNWTGSNDERWCNPAYDALYQQVTAELDPNERAQLFIKMNDMLVEDVVMIPIVHLADVQGVNHAIVGVDLTPWDVNTWNIKDWRRTTP